MMKASAFEFRYRFWILLAIYVLGFVAPWDYWLRLDGAGPNTHVWGRLAIELSRAGMSITVAFNLVLAAGIVLAFAGAALRTWGTACLGPEVMRGRELRGATPEEGSSSASQNGGAEQPGLVVEGPYRYMRNPPYVGSWLNALALALLMPPTGAVFTLALLTVFQVRLILAEEAWLGARLGAAYAEYCARAPRIVPRVGRDRVRISPQVLKGEAPGAPNVRVRHTVRWGQAALTEIFLWGTAVSFAAVGWEYNAHLLIQCVVVSLGLALVVRGIGMPAVATHAR